MASRNKLGVSQIEGTTVGCFFWSQINPSVSIVSSFLRRSRGGALLLLSTGHTFAKHLRKNILHSTHACKTSTVSKWIASCSETGEHLFLFMFATVFSGSNCIVRCLDLFESGLSIGRSFISIRVILASKFAKSLLDFSITCST